MSPTQIAHLEVQIGDQPEVEGNLGFVDEGQPVDED
jgi:hypothetical protein